MQYTLFIWLFTLCLAFLVNCQGKDGLPGDKGAQGDGCAVTQLSNGAEIKCAGQTTAVILNGAVGPAGQDLAPGPYSVSGIVDPCGKQGAYDEVLLRLSNGSLLAHYSDGAKQFFALIGPGSYVTTDGTNCHFTVNADQTVSN